MEFFSSLFSDICILPFFYLLTRLEYALDNILELSSNSQVYTLHNIHLLLRSRLCAPTLILHAVWPRSIFHDHFPPHSHPHHQPT